jgi:hypothetical protein
VVEKMRVRILDETGDTTLTVDSKEELMKEVSERNLTNRWFYIDGQFTPDISQADITDTQEVVVSQRLIGG